MSSEIIPLQPIGLLSVDEVRARIEYNPDTGLFRWLNPNSHQAVSWFKGNKSVRQYRRLWILGRHILAHNVAWALMTGRWPEHEIDHRNRQQGDNRWSNLRSATHAENSRNRSVGKNSSTGVVGVSRFGKRFRACIRFQGKQLSLGLFSTIEEAAIARRDKAETLYADFAAGN
jgi:HNH endonuclease